MAAKDRDEFSAADKLTLGERAAYICSNPFCRRQTIGPHSDEKKSLRTGKACHIRGAAPGGPRYDISQTREERRHIRNGIWLCSVCSDLIDKDEARFGVDLLHRWRDEHEEWLRSGGIFPTLPELTLTTLQGLSIPNEPSTVNLSDLEHIREHRLLLRNVSTTELFAIEAQIHLAEPVLRSTAMHLPPGNAPIWQPLRPDTVVTGSPGASVTRGRPPLPTNHYRLAIDSLSPNQYLEIGLLTSILPWKEHDIDFDSPLYAGMNEPPSTMRYFDGSAQFDYQGARLMKTIFAPIAYDKATRQQSFIEVREDYGEWQRVEGSFFS